MRYPRIFVDTALKVGGRISLPVAPTRHLIQVLRLTMGSPLILFNGNGRDYAARLLGVSHLNALVNIEGMTDPEPLAPFMIHLALGIFRGDRMDYALQKSVELGVGRITPLFTERSQIQIEGLRAERRTSHWRGIVTNACEQCGRRRLPLADSPINLSDWLLKISGGLLLDSHATQALTSVTPPENNLIILIGPEGGLSPREQDQVQRRNFHSVRLGPRILRAETAPVVALSIIQALWGDLRDIQH